jgi:hypothetical protein
LLSSNLITTLTEWSSLNSNPYKLTFLHIPTQLYIFNTSN